MPRYIPSKSVRILKTVFVVIQTRALRERIERAVMEAGVRDSFVYFHSTELAASRAYKLPRVHIVFIDGWFNEKADILARKLGAVMQGVIVLVKISASDTKPFVVWGDVKSIVLKPDEITGRKLREVLGYEEGEEK